MNFKQKLRVKLAKDCYFCRLILYWWLAIWKMNGASQGTMIRIAEAGTPI